MRFILSAALAAWLCTPALARAPAGPACMTPQSAFTTATEHGSTIARLDGDEAETLLRQLNEFGEKTDYHAPTVIVVLRPTEAIVALFSPCHSDDIRMRLDDFQEIWVKARGIDL